MTKMPSIGISGGIGGGGSSGPRAPAGGGQHGIGGGGNDKRDLELAGARPHTRGSSAGSETAAQLQATSRVRCTGIAGGGGCARGPTWPVPQGGIGGRGAAQCTGKQRQK